MEETTLEWSWKPMLELESKVKKVCKLLFLQTFLSKSLANLENLSCGMDGYPTDARQFYPSSCFTEASLFPWFRPSSSSFSTSWRFLSTTASWCLDMRPSTPLFQCSLLSLIQTQMFNQPWCSHPCTSRFRKAERWIWKHSSFGSGNLSTR